MSAQVPGTAPSGVIPSWYDLSKNSPTEQREQQKAIDAPFLTLSLSSDHRSEGSHCTVCQSEQAKHAAWLLEPLSRETVNKPADQGRFQCIIREEQGKCRHHSPPASICLHTQRRERFLIIIGDMQEVRDQSGRARLSTSAMACGVPIGPPRSIGRENGIGIARHVETRCENSWKRNG